MVANLQVQGLIAVWVVHPKFLTKRPGAAATLTEKNSTPSAPAIFLDDQLGLIAQIECL
jgi:hypothetical protein